MKIIVITLDNQILLVCNSKGIETVDITESIMYTGTINKVILDLQSKGFEDLSKIYEFINDN